MAPVGSGGVVSARSRRLVLGLMSTGTADSPEAAGGEQTNARPIAKAADVLRAGLSKQAPPSEVTNKGNPPEAAAREGKNTRPIAKPAIKHIAKPADVVGSGTSKQVPPSVAANKGNPPEAVAREGKNTRPIAKPAIKHIAKPADVVGSGTSKQVPPSVAANKGNPPEAAAREGKNTRPIAKPAIKHIAKPADVVGSGTSKQVPPSVAANKGNPPEAPAREGKNTRPIAKPADAVRAVTPKQGPPSEVADKDGNVQQWLNRQPSSPLSIPSIAQGPATEGGLTTARRQQGLRPQPVVKQLFASPVKTAPATQRVRASRQKVPFKRGRGSGGASVALGDSPGTNWRKRLPSISVTTTISPAKSDELEDGNVSLNPDILIEVSTEQTPGKWNTVTYRNHVGSPSGSGTWLMETDQDKEIQEDNADENNKCDNVDTVDISAQDGEGLAEPLRNHFINEERRPAPTFNRKRTSNVLRSNSPRVRMVCREDSQPQFFIQDSDDDDEPDAVQETNEPGTENQDQDQPPNQKKKRVDAPRANTRKRLINKDKWKNNIAKKGFNEGIEYTTSRGKTKKARQLKPACSSKCNRCERIILPEERQDIFDAFWALEDLDKKRDFLSRLIDEHIPSSCSTSPDCAKKSIRRYHFVIESEEVRVCKTMFLKTLDIPDVWIETTLKKITPTGMLGDNRGKHDNRPKRIPEATLQSVRDHIELFPRVQSHYTRESTKREYLETHVVSVERMHNLYLEWAKENNIEKPASISAYRNIFNTEFNLGFFLPRKDQCETCSKWKSSNPEERREMVTKYAEHLENKKQVRALKKQDTLSASITKCVACFDLQKVLICPRSEVSLFFYLNKLSLYDFTVFDLHPGEGHCYLWTEVDGAKGANEIGTNLLFFIETKIDEGVQEFVFYSDSPSGQNRNRMIFSMYVHACIKYNIKITHRFLESGHSYSEADGMHARIENEAKAKQEIFTPDEWIDLIKTAKKDGKPYIVNTVKNEEWLNLHALVDQETWVKDTKNHKVLWSKVREVVADCNAPNCIFYRYNFTNELSKLEVKLKTGGTIDHKTYKYPAAYTSKFSMKEKKKKDIRKLMKRGAIPSKYHPTFERYLI